MADLIKHIFFDFDDTLWDFKKNSAVVLEELFKEHELAGKLKTDFPLFQERYREVNLGLWSKYYKRQIDKAQMRNNRFNMVFNLFGYDNYEENLLITEKYIHQTPKGICLKEGCIETLKYLAAKYQLHIITNGFKEIQDIKLDGCGLRPFFKHIIISEDHQLLKPEIEVFRLAEKLAGARPDECVMIGDSIESDVEGALNAGWQAIYYAGDEPVEYKGRFIRNLCELKEMF